MVLLIIFILIFSSCSTCVYASTPSTYYARIMQDNTYLYKSAVNVDDYSNIYFILPKTYFVELIDESNNGFYKVNYMSFTGYVKKDSVQAIAGKPINPYLTNINFRVYSEQSRDLRSEPITTSGSSSQVAYIPLMCRNLTYYGTIQGEQLIEGRTNVWYYCKYSADKDYYGYVYSDFCDELTKINENTEQVTYISSPDFNPQQEIPTTLPLKNKTTGIVVAVLCVPAGIFLFMIFKNKRILAQESSHAKEIVDY